MSPNRRSVALLRAALQCIALGAVLVVTACDRAAPVVTDVSSLAGGAPSAAPVVRAHLQVVPDAGRLYAQWLLTTPVPLTLEWRETGGATVWQARRVAAGRRAMRIEQLETGAAYEVRLRLGDSVLASKTVRVGMATSCFRDGIWWYAPMLLLCSDADVERVLQAHPEWRGAPCPDGIGALGDPAGTWSCVWELDGRYVLLLRAASDDFHDAAEPDLVRTLTRRLLWGTGDPWDQDRADAVTLRSGGTAALDTLLVPGRQGLRSRVIVHPYDLQTAPVRGTVIWLEGHGADGTVQAAREIAWFLARGFRVYSQDMPLEGRNEVDRRTGAEHHVALFGSAPSHRWALRAMLEPTKVLVDYVARAHPGEPIILVGRSGGGWSSYVYATLDERVTYAVSIAGGLPSRYRVADPDMNLGDSEQHEPQLYGAIGHEVLMAAAGRDGGFHTWSEFDECCYRLSPSDPLLGYLERAGQRSSRRVTAFVAAGSTAHAIGPAALSRLEGELDRLYPYGRGVAR